MVLIAMYRTKTLRSTSNFFIASLAAADLVVGFLLNPILAAKTLIFSYLYPDRQVAGSAFDKAEDFFWIQAVVATTFGLTAISIDRYIAVNLVFRYEHLMTESHCVAVTAFVWLSSVVFASVRLFTDKPNHLSVLWLVMAIITCILPFVVITYCYLSIFKSARQQVKKILHESGTAESKQRRRQQIAHRKTACTVAIVILLFAILWFPSLVVASIQLNISGSDKPKDQALLKILEREVWEWVSFFAYLSSASNPWIYAMRIGEFKEACKQLFKCIHWQSENTNAQQPNETGDYHKCQMGRVDC